MKKPIIFILLIILSLPSLAQNTNEFKAETFILGTDTLLYRILMPVNFNPDEEYPILFFLHGSGERGSDNQGQLTHGG
ncbi:MAG TPA: hypothetical protein VLZ28_03890, partial [Daejeonella sp.]|nr:hypothetical protein [Daejeonella sp.]